MTPPRQRGAGRRATVRRHAVLATIPVAAAVLLGAAEAPAAMSTGASGLRDPYYPLSGNGGYHVEHYDLTLRYETATRRLDGTAVLTVHATQPLSRFDLDLHGLEVTGVTVDRERANVGRTGQELVITPHQALRKDQVFTVTVAYNGTPEPVTDPDGNPDGWVPTDDGAFVAGQPQGSMTWFPGNNHPRDKSSYDFTITVPEDRTAVANGVLVGQSTANGRTTFRWRQSEPMAAYLATASIGKFQVEKYTTRDGIQIYNAVDPRQAKASAPVLKNQSSVLEWGSKIFGPYPYRSAGSIVDHAPAIGYALESQGRPVYDSAPDLHTFVHEIAHQWFGDSVSITSWKDIWLNEGFASYAEWLYDEQHGGDSAQDTFDVLYATDADDELWDFPPGDPGSGENLFATPVYDRGAMVLHELRRAVGDTTFFRILREWPTQHRDGHGTTAEFVSLAEQESGKDLGALFQTWLYEDGKPKRA
ncbi:M1 family metallopeptidase [Streptomyces sp. NPDC006012]|uniref:M1 family metallopeptidase n=1 Tax=Streptomyces sp. NPDC006012 TaxID=3364739 RepID=UPI0036BD560F